MKDKTTAGVLAFLIGGIGGHKFYLGQTGLGVLYLMFCWTLIPGFIGLIEGISLLTMSQGAFDVKYNGGQYQLAAPPPQNIVVNVANNTALAAGGSGTDFASQIKQLHELKIAGALTEEEFSSEKQKLLSGH